MIHDSLDHADRYATLHPGFAAAFDFLRQPELFDMPPGKYRVDETVSAEIAVETARPVERARLEGHRKFIDIHYVIDGPETMGWLTAARAGRPEAPYDPSRDLAFFHDPPESWITVSPGEFVVFWPEDLHAPLLGTGTIRKVVLKIRL